ncbi:coiled-coil domain-containing protein 159 [Eublepharis macularius]|uniref:Coiled-coil domain-containing protein 159 n=1 Tax=Eublepharis macularius TaxID=481883 RepID=A0AA97KNG2_EUBMA|nr:coiled-coil domain-containing protein 159 [Eublepharis macularius]
MLASPGMLSMTIATDERSRDVSPSCFVSRSGSTSSTGQLERSALKSPGVMPESQLMLKNELELIRAQLQAQTKAFEALSHSITLLEQESNQQQSRIAQLEEELRFATSSSRETLFEGLMQKRIQELWRAVAMEVEGLHGSMKQKESCVENLSQEVLESKKFLWEELEAVQGELQRIHQKLRDQEVDITRNLVSIKKMQDNQVRCTRFLAQLKGRVSGDASETMDNKPRSDEGDDAWLADSLSSCSIWGEKRGPLRKKSRGSRYHHRKASSSSLVPPDSSLHQQRSSS